MSAVYLPRIASSAVNNDRGSLYFATITMTSGTYSDSYILPLTQIYSIAASISGTGVIEFTNDPPSAIEAGTAAWIAWDGSSNINNGVTGFRVAYTSGTVVAKVAVKTCTQ